MIRSLQYSDGTSLDKNRPKRYPAIETLPYNFERGALADAGLTPPAARTRPANWPALTAFTPGVSRAQGLVGAYNNRCFTGFSATGTGLFVDWGEGAGPQAINSGTFYSHTYAFNSSNMVHDYTSTRFTAATTFTNTAATFIADLEVNVGTPVIFSNITGVTDIVVGTTYYIRSFNSTTNELTISSTVNGTAITFTNNGTANITVKGWTPYFITITGTTITGITWGSAATTDTFLKEVSYNLPSATSFPIQQNPQNTYGILSVSIGQYSGPAFNLQNYVSLEYFPLGINCTLTSLNNFFDECGALTHAPNLTLAATVAASYTFRNCYNLVSVPNYNTVITNASFMFSNCRKLHTAPTLDLSLATNTANMFYYCNSLRVVPTLNLPVCTSALQMFMYSGILEIPDIIFGTAVNTQEMFQFAWNLWDISRIQQLLTYSNNVSLMFAYCSRISEVPSIVINNSVTTLNSMFAHCYGIAKYNTITLGTNTTSLSGLCSYNSGLIVPPEFLPSTTQITNFSSLFYSCDSLGSIPDYDYSNATTLLEMVGDCGNLRSISINNLSNCTNISQLFSYTALSSFTIPVTADNCNCSALFYGCNLLQTVTISDETKFSMYQSMFYDCESLHSIYGIDNIKNKLRFSRLTDSGVFSNNSIFNGCKSLTDMDLTINPSANASNAGWFYNCYALRSAKVKSLSASTLILNGSLTNTFNLESLVLEGVAVAYIGTIATMLVSGRVRLKHLEITNIAPTQNVAPNLSGFANSLKSVILGYSSTPTTVCPTLSMVNYDLDYVILDKWRDPISVTQNNLSDVAINELFTSLGNARNPGSTTISVSANPGYQTGVYNASIATAKGWVVS